MNSIRTKTQFGTCILHLALCAFLILLFGCGSSSGTSDDSAAAETGSLTFSLAWEGVPGEGSDLQAQQNVCTDYGISQVSGELTNSRGVQIDQQSEPCSAHRMLFDEVPAGSGMTLLMKGYVLGVHTWVGQVTAIQLSPNENKDLGVITMRNISGDDDPPEVVADSENPPDGATDVSVGTSVSVRFSEEMAVSTVQANFTLTGTSGSVTYNASTRTATFTPDRPLAESTAYTATVKKEVEDQAGNKMAADFSWGFTTGREDKSLIWDQGKWDQDLWS